IVSKVGQFDDWPMILIDVYTRDGVVGRSYVEPYLKGALECIMALIRTLGAALIGKPIAPLDAFQSNRRSQNLIGYEGIAMIASSGIDMAIWDALAKAAGLPLTRLLGGTVGHVPAYNSNGLWLTEVSTLAKEAAELTAEGGFKALKLRLGRDDLAADLDAISEVRQGAGASVNLMVDFNQGLSLGDGLARCHALDDQGLYWLEEPIAYDNLAGYAQLTHELKTPVQLGENFYGPRELYKAVLARAGDYMMPDLMRIGGVSGWLRSVPIAAAAGIQVSTHLYPEFSAHLMRATETAHWLEWQDWADPILKDPFTVRNGQIEIPERPGAGIEWDEAAVKRYAI
ncbi:enolase C-terminal domain-like protein, partial [Bradyrhizobium sp.]|uniref:enolase C-terminal domain-like protein n=1 Tax=Bradyrhizobium sp. TaxID=376 RepID=UPI002736FA41